MEPTRMREDPPPRGDVTELLARARGGDGAAASDLIDRVYDQLYRIARGVCGRGGAQTMSATALVHEAFVRLRGADFPDFTTRRHFYAFAAKVMRSVLVDYARRNRAKKRGQGVRVLPLDEARDLVSRAQFDWLELDAALERLASRDSSLVALVELRLFGGLSSEDVAAELAVSERTVRRRWRLAKAWLQRELSCDDMPA